MKHLLLILILLLPNTASAQSPNDDKGMLINWLQDALSGAGRQVRIDGFRGALSSAATLDLLSIADDSGVWLTLENARLSWNRGALLKGRLDIETLTAERLTVLRLPETQASGISPEAGERTQFQLPDLPVSIDIQTLGIERVQLHKALLGEPAILSLDGTVHLIGGAGQADLTIERLDSTPGHLRFNGQFANGTGDLRLSLDLSEGAGGIAARLLHLPDQPALSLDIKGGGTLPDFNADMVLTTDNQPRLRGIFQLSPSTGAETESAQKQQFSANLSGDITPLLAPQFRPFFGDTATLTLAGNYGAAGTVILDHLNIRTKSLDISGRLALAPDGLPDYFDLRAHIGNESNTPITLPLPGSPTQLRNADLQAHFQSSQGNTWTLQADFNGLDRTDVKIDSGRLSSKGLMFRQSTAPQSNGIRRVSTDITAKLSGLQPSDDTLAKALGDETTATLSLEWRTDQPLQFPHFKLASSGGLQISGQGTLGGNSEGFRLSGDVTMDTGDLQRMDRFREQGLLGGDSALELGGWWQPIGGAFDLTFAGQLRNLRFSGTTPLGVFAGSNTLQARLIRSPAGLDIQQLELNGPVLKGNAVGTLSSDDSYLEINAHLANIARLVPSLSGPASIRGTLAQQSGPWLIKLTGSGPGGSRVAITGDVAPTMTHADLGLAGSLPIGLFNSFTAPNAQLQGTAQFNLSLLGPITPGSLSGTVRTSNATVAMPRQGISLRQIDGRADISGGQAVLDISANVAGGGHISVQGKQGLAGPFISDLNVTLGGVNLTKPPTFRTKMDGTLRLSGPAGNGSVISGTIDLLETELRLVPTNDAAEIPLIQHHGDSGLVRATRRRAGLSTGSGPVSSGNGGLTLDVLVRAAERVFIRGRGLDAEMGGTLRLTGTTTNIVPSGQFNLIRGRLDLLGKRFDLQSGHMGMQGSFNPTYRLSALTQTTDALVRVTLSGTPDAPEFSFRSNPDLPDDEILAQLVFGKGLSTISPLQALQLANAISTLTGSGREGVLDKLRNNVGLDDLDISTPSEGGVALKAGKYVSDSTYVDVTINSNGRNEINLNLELSPNITASGRLGNDGNAGIGLFFQKDY